MGPTVPPATFVTDVEPCVVVGLVGDELDPHGWALADYTLERYRPPTTRVEQHYGTGIQAAPQHQPVGPQMVSYVQQSHLALKADW